MNPQGVEKHNRYVMHDILNVSPSSFGSISGDEMASEDEGDEHLIFEESSSSKHNSLTD